jgi:hypothetical protein
MGGAREKKDREGLARLTSSTASETMSALQQNKGREGTAGREWGGPKNGAKGVGAAHLEHRVRDNERIQRTKKGGSQGRERGGGETGVSQNTGVSHLQKRIRDHEHVKGTTYGGVGAEKKVEVGTEKDAFLTSSTASETMSALKPRSRTFHAPRTSRTRTSQMDHTYAGGGKGGAVRILGREG